MRKSLLALSLGIALPAAWAQPAGALYRSGMPEVLAPAPAPAAPADPAFHAGAFASAYARAGRPAIAVLWNREFSDMLEQGSLRVLRTDVESGAAAGSVATRTPGTRTALAAAESRTTAVTTLGDVRTQQEQRAAPVESTDLQMRTAFLNAMTSRGVNLVDRNTVMRTTSRNRKGADAQHVETEALARHARLLMEVLNTPDAASPTGWATHVTIKRFSDGRILASGYIDGKGFNAGPVRFEADPNGGGFREVTPAAAQPSDLGRMAAEHALARLGQALAR
jgi:hypothetical protein